MHARIAALAIATVALSHASAPPKLPYLDWKACPFEGCTYRRWIAQAPVNVYDDFKERRHRIAVLSKGEAVTGITGVVITLRPGVIRMDRDVRDQNLHAGDKILTYTYQGEGYSAVWFGGNFYPSFDISFAKWPDGAGCGGAHCAATYIDLGEKIWWAKIKLKSGRTGWVNMSRAKFDGTDSLAREKPASFSATPCSVS